MVEVHLPFSSTLYICTTCGMISGSRGLALKCESVPVWESPDVQVGQPVWVYDRTTRRDHTGRRERPVLLLVCRLFYARPGAHIGFGHYAPLQPKPHQLCIELCRGEQWDEKQTLDPHAIGFNAIVVLRSGMTYAEFALWREGDQQKLAAAGLINPPKRHPILGVRR